MIYKENTEQKVSARIKKCGIYKKPTFICGLSTEWYFWRVILECAAMNCHLKILNRRANARKKTPGHRFGAQKKRPRTPGRLLSNMR